VRPFTCLAPLPEFEYLVPETLQELLRMLDEYNERAKIIAGGTDLTILLKDRAIKPEFIIDISRLKKELGYIREVGSNIEVGSLTTHSEISESELLMRKAECLVEACSTLGTWQVRNLGTIGGNLVNASPAADTAPPLLVLNASITLKSLKNERILKLEEFFKGVKQTVIKPNEVLEKIFFKPLDKDKYASTWMRIGRRNANSISVVSVANVIKIEDYFFEDVRIALGAVAPTPIIAREASNFLKGKRVNIDNIEKAAEIAASEARPISDIRASEWYRREMIKVLTKRSIIKSLEKLGVTL
jgi:carbon-monoxide dehydrogenase medium subunit